MFSDFINALRRGGSRCLRPLVGAVALVLVLGLCFVAVPKAPAAAAHVWNLAWGIQDNNTCDDADQTVDTIFRDFDLREAGSKGPIYNRVECGYRESLGESPIHVSLTTHTEVSNSQADQTLADIKEEFADNNGTFEIDALDPDLHRVHFANDNKVVHGTIVQTDNGGLCILRVTVAKVEGQEPALFPLHNVGSSLTDHCTRQAA